MVVEFNHLLPTMPELGMGLPNDYTLFRKEITILVRSKHKAINLVTAIISMGCGRLKNDVRVIMLLSRAIISRCKSSILLGLQHE